MKKKLLSEAQVRRFMGLAGINPINEMAYKEDEEPMEEMMHNEGEEDLMEALRGISYVPSQGRRRRAGR